jgi:hypothetical protein
MIHHISIAAKNPQRVAQVLAELFQGRAFPFPPHPGSFMVFPLDEHGTGVEVYPLGTELIPGQEDEQVTFVKNSFSSLFTATHAAISVPVSEELIQSIGAREGWRTVRCDRDGLFEVIEFWVENRLMVELLTPSMVAKYLGFTRADVLEQVFAAAPAAH